MNWISLWAMVRPRLAAALVGGIIFLLTAAGVAELTEEDRASVQKIADGLAYILGTMGYALYHTWSEKRKLERGEVVPSRIESLSRFEGLHPLVAKGRDEP